AEMILQVNGVAANAARAKDATHLAQKGIEIAAADMLQYRMGPDQVNAAIGNRTQRLDSTVEIGGIAMGQQSVQRSQRFSRWRRQAHLLEVPCHPAINGDVTLREITGVDQLAARRTFRLRDHCRAQRIAGSDLETCVTAPTFEPRHS